MDRDDDRQHGHGNYQFNIGGKTAGTTALRWDLSQPLPRLRLDAGFHALALARASGAVHSRSVPLFRCHADHSAGAGGVPGVFRRAADGTGPARRAGAHHRRPGSGRDRAAPGRDAEHARVSWKTRTSRACEAERRREFAGETGARAGARGRGVSRPSPDALRQTMARYMAGGARGAAAAAGDLFAIAAPHVSPEGGWQSYRAAYRLLRPEHRDRTFVILATSHYGEPGKFGLTRKTFRTPLGRSRDRPRAGGLAGRARRRAPWRWRITATPSSTPWSCR